MKQQRRHLAKRELQDLLRRRGLWLGVFTAGILLGLVGPFDTDVALQLIQRMVYWCLVACVTFATGASVFILLWHVLGGRFWLALVSAPALICIAVLLELMLPNTVFFGVISRTGLFDLALDVLAVSVVLTVATVLIWREGEEDDLPTVRVPDGPRLLQRLDPEKRGILVSVSAVDHYVDVVTDAGNALVLLRLGDAMAETSPVSGLQIHRSHGVAIDAIADVLRDGGRTIVVLRDGRKLPVSRTYLPGVRALLERSS